MKLKTSLYYLSLLTWLGFWLFVGKLSNWYFLPSSQALVCLPIGFCMWHSFIHLARPFKPNLKPIPFVAILSDFGLIMAFSLFATIVFLGITNSDNLISKIFQISLSKNPFGIQELYNLNTSGAILFLTDGLAGICMLNTFFGNLFPSLKVNLITDIKPKHLKQHTNFRHTRKEITQPAKIARISPAPLANKPLSLLITGLALAISLRWLSGISIVALMLTPIPVVGYFQKLARV